MDANRAIAQLESLKLHCESMIQSDEDIFWEHDVNALAIAIKQVGLNREYQKLVDHCIESFIDAIGSFGKGSVYEETIKELERRFEELKVKGIE